MLDSHWRDMAITAELRRQRSSAPRLNGVTMVIDIGLGISATSDLLEMAGDYVDLWKLSFGTSIFVPPQVLARKLKLINSHGILTCPGGTLFEAVALQKSSDLYMQWVVEAGFAAVEISDGTIDLSESHRQAAIECARRAGLIAVTEVGKKNPLDQPSADKLAEQALRDFECGAQWVIVEGRESGTSVGFYDVDGNIEVDALEVFAQTLGEHHTSLIWEAPLKDQQAALVGRFGVNVNLGNIAPERVLSLEALRLGLRFETLKPIAEELGRNGLSVVNPSVKGMASEAFSEANARIQPTASLQFP